MTRATVAEAKHLEGKIIRWRSSLGDLEMVYVVDAVMPYEEFASLTGNSVPDDATGKAVLKCMNLHGNVFWKRAELDKWEIYEE